MKKELKCLHCTTVLIAADNWTEGSPFYCDDCHLHECEVCKSPVHDWELCQDCRFDFELRICPNCCEERRHQHD